MPYSIKAYFPLGFYQGKGIQGGFERLPTPARLHAALVAGAYNLERLEGRFSGSLSPLDQSVFDWLEACPPDAVLAPHCMADEGNAIAYRNTGLIGASKKTKTKGDAAFKKVSASSRCFLDGSISWFWVDVPSDEIRDRIDQIVQEVPYLGEAVCPVIIGASSIEEIPQNALHRCAPSFDSIGLAIAQPGRHQAWEQSYKKTQEPIKRDAAVAKEEEKHAEYPLAGLGTAYYEDSATARLDKATNAPWIHGYMLQVSNCSGKRLSQEDYVEWAVCLHRAIVKQFGDALPKCLQRMSPDGHSLANGVAIQILSDAFPIADEYAIDGDAFIAMMPRGASHEEVQLVLGALSHVRHLYSRSLGKIDVMLTGERIDLSRFWKPVPEGFHRIFQPVPLFIPDTRPPSKRKPDGGRWTMDDDARVAIGHVWRDMPSFVVDESGDAGRIVLSRQVDEAGVQVFGGRIVPTGNIRSYIHKTPKGSMLVGGQTCIDLAAIGCNECLTAIGQTRHLGGGLLVPTDFPVNSAGAASKGE
jgi:CRISPR-associated protein Csb2